MITLEPITQTSVGVGIAGETLIASALERAGYQVQFTSERMHGDLTVITPTGETLHIEVKTARCGKDNVYRFTLWKHWQGRQRTDHRYADFVILICAHKTGVTPFVIPVSACKDKHHISMRKPWQYGGWASVYRQNIRKLSLPQ